MNQPVSDSALMATSLFIPANHTLLMLQSNGKGSDYR